MNLSKRLARVERAVPPPPPLPPPAPALEADYAAVAEALCAIASGDGHAADHLSGPTREAVERMRSVASAVKAVFEHHHESGVTAGEVPGPGP